METNPPQWPLANDFLNPLSGWEAATRWQAASFDWMVKGWQQWLALLTTMPPQFLAAPGTEPPSALPRVASEAIEARPRAHETKAVRATAKLEPRRSTGAPARKKKRPGGKAAGP